MKEGKLVFDPRPKLLLLFTMGVFVLGNAGGDLFDRYTPLFCIVPMILFVLDGKWKTGAWYLILYAVAYGLYIGILPRLSGVIGYLLLACCGILTRFLPGIMTGSYLIRTTKVSEFNAAMERMHVSENRLVPLLVCSAKIGEKLNAAAITRGLGADRKRTNVCQIGFHAQDHILFTLCVTPYVIWAGALIRSLIV